MPASIRSTTRGKELCFGLPLEVRDGVAGLMVMTCYMADIQFMGFPLVSGVDTQGWISLAATVQVVTDAYGQKRLALRPRHTDRSAPPDSLILKA